MPTIRDATLADLPALVRLLGHLNENVPRAPTEGHRAAFEAMATDARQRLLVVSMTARSSGRRCW